jgi:hypothetical protein
VALFRLLFRLLFAAAQQAGAGGGTVFDLQPRGNF